MTEGRTIPIKLTNDMLINLLRGGTVNYIIDGVHIMLIHEEPLVVIEKEHYRQLKINMNSPWVLEQIFREIDK